MSLTDPYLQIDDVTFGYSSRVILDDVSLSFGRGQVVQALGDELQVDRVRRARDQRAQFAVEDFAGDEAEAHGGQ